MKKITKEELIKIITEKRDSAHNALSGGFYQTDVGKYKLYGELDAYADLICYLDSVSFLEG